MNRILIASALVLGVSGAAMAQQAPYTIGNYSAAVEQSLNPGFEVEPSLSNIDVTTTSSITTYQNDATGTVSNVSIPLENGGR